MNVSIPDTLKLFVDRQTAAGKFASADHFVAELIATEAELVERVGLGHPLPTDEHLARRLASLLDEAERSGEPIAADEKEFAAIEADALKIVESRGRL